MEQRLNIEIVAGEKEVCNVYMHWGGYTTLSILYTLDIISAFKNYKFNELKRTLIIKNYSIYFAKLFREQIYPKMKKNIFKVLEFIFTHRKKLIEMMD